MKKGVAVFLMVLIILVSFILPDLLKKNEDGISVTTTETDIGTVTVTTDTGPDLVEYDWSYKIDDSEPLTRGLLAKMLALLINSKNQVYQNYDREIGYTDTDSESWYDKYTNVVYVDNEINIIDIIVIGTPANIAGLNSWELVSDKGKYIFEGLNVDRLLDKKIKVVARGSEIIAVLQVVEEDPLITNAWIETTTDSTARIFIHGEYRDYNVIGNIESTRILIVLMELM